MKWGIFCLFENFEKNYQKAISEQINLVKHAEKIGLDEAWFAEHHFNDFSLCPSPSLLLANAIAQTTKIRLGMAGFLAPFYDTIRLSEEVATLDILSNGRINLGLAKGAFTPDSKHFKTTTENLRPKLIECAEAINLLLNSKGPVSFNGDFISFSEVDIEPKPLQNQIPTYIATFASKETIDFAAHRGWGLLLSQGVDLDECQSVVNRYKEIAGFDPEVVLLRTFFTADSDEEANERAIPAIDHFVKSMRAASSFNKSPNFDRSKYEDIIKERDYFFDGEKFFKNGIIGDVNTCIKKSLEIKKIIKNVHIALKPLGVSEAENIEQLDIFVNKIRKKVDKRSI
ncbi:LLM class flavin-dependent oxidoreductase [Campylobacter sp. RM16187]|uniref:LLM class flavin-dependent oxidoreductase n=1 Tax=Campylobacter sp. RM16187 TaxID=1660063 RepID=UPI0021B66F19|nr:LLM class flavin-dependent oxidoreductase [Campylobacter sp. RM16187]QKG30235.1 luciferase-like monooxygenase [Campylobacter sp. RM16187]